MTIDTSSLDQSTDHISSARPALLAMAQFCNDIAASSVVNVNDAPFYAKGDNTIDDAVAWRAAIAYLKSVGGGVLIAPSPNYYFKSYALMSTALPAVTWQNDPCVLLDGCSNIFFMTGGSKIHIDNSIASAHPNTSGASTFGFHNCKNIKGYLPEIAGNRTGLSSAKFNNGIWYESCIGVNFQDLKFSGSFDGGSCIAGGHVYDSAFGKIAAENASFVFDGTCFENVSVDSIVCTGTAPVSGLVAAVKIFSDPVSLAYNVTGRALVAGMSSNVHIRNVAASGYANAAYFDGVDDASVCVDVFSGSKGVTVTTSTTTNGLGKITSNVKVNGAFRGLSSDALYLDTQGYGLKNVTLNGASVSGCAGYAVSYGSIVNLGAVNLIANNFTGQTNTISDLLAQGIYAGGGMVIGNINYNPKLIAINRALPGGIGIGNKSTNNWPFNVSVTINTTGSGYVPHIVEPNATDINLGIAGANQVIQILLSPGESIYFESALPTQWQWRGM